ncbi:MAG: hypothetical protein EBT79_07590 [Actinobacteria bacterium]|nr:hypothetical protein [Actinomycetota bacterium]NBR67122.1 hypothetical protein [Actinomycetota bacterium]
MTDPKTTLAQANPHAIVLEGHDDALIGIVWLPGQTRPVALYDDTLLAESILDQNPDWSMDDAYDWIDANVPIGVNAPAVIEVMADADELDDFICWS